MLAVAASDVAIALAAQKGELVVAQHEGRLGTYWSISDARGLIEVALSEQETQARVAKFIDPRG